jgi:hypothetical protein
MSAKSEPGVGVPNNSHASRPKIPKSNQTVNELLLLSASASTNTNLLNQQKQQFDINSLLVNAILAAAGLNNTNNNNINTNNNYNNNGQPNTENKENNTETNASKHESVEPIPSSSSAAAPSPPPPVSIEADSLIESAYRYNKPLKTLNTSLASTQSKSDLNLANDGQFSSLYSQSDSKKRKRSQSIVSNGTNSSSYNFQQFDDDNNCNDKDKRSSTTPKHLSMPSDSQRSELSRKKILLETEKQLHLNRVISACL